MLDTPSIVIKFNLEVNLAKGLGPRCWLMFTKKIKKIYLKF
jgi:hypothetical protein